MKFIGLALISFLGVNIALAGGDDKKAPAAPAAAKEDQMVSDFVKLRDEYVTQFRPLFEKMSRAWWDANTTGDEAAFKRKVEADNALIELHSNKTTFAAIKSFRDAGKVTEPVLKRQLDVMYRTFLRGQGDPELQKRIVALESEVEETFNKHRSQVGDKTMTENDVREALKGTDSAAAEKAWKGYMAVGEKLAPKLAELVTLRNQLAKSLGFRDYFAMNLSMNEIDEAQLMALFDEVDGLTKEPFAQLKREIDASRAAQFKIAEKDLRPWHFGDLFFQEAPGLAKLDLDNLYKDKDLVALTKMYYESIGMNIDDILSRSDLYEKSGKSPHAFSTNLNRGDDVRILCNLKPNMYWADTVLHEMGHAVYDKYIGKNVPFLLHEPSHSLTTEGYAMMMGSMAQNEDWLTKGLKLPADQVAPMAASIRKNLKAEKLIFARWSQVMTRFEKGMYGNPSQDLGKLWWDLKARYQLLNPPETTARPDYAAKIHIVTSPVYYYSYMMGELFASQVRAHIAQKVLKVSDPAKTSFFGERAAGEYMIREIFEPGDLLSWNELTKQATGEPLSAKYFAQLYVN